MVGLSDMLAALTQAAEGAVETIRKTTDYERKAYVASRLGEMCYRLANQRVRELEEGLWEGCEDMISANITIYMRHGLWNKISENSFLLYMPFLSPSEKLMERLERLLYLLQPGSVAAVIEENHVYSMTRPGRMTLSGIKDRLDF